MDRSKSLRPLFFLVLFLAILYFMNPSPEKHFEKLKKVFPNEYGDDMGDDDTFDNRFTYHDYYFFSTTTENSDGNNSLTSFGILGSVL